MHFYLAPCLNILVYWYIHILSIFKVCQNNHLKLLCHFGGTMMGKSKILAVRYLHLKCVIMLNFVKLPNLFNAWKILGSWTKLLWLKIILEAKPVFWYNNLLCVLGLAVYCGSCRRSADSLGLACETGALKAAALLSFYERRGLLSLDSGNCSTGAPENCQLNRSTEKLRPLEMLCV